MKRLASGAPLVIVVVLLAGCGADSGLAVVKGVVTLDDQPAAGLEVAFEPKNRESGTTAVGYTQDDGSYQLYYLGGKPGAPLGEHIVRITGAETDNPAEQRVVDRRFNIASEVTATVGPGKNELNFAVTSR